MLPVTVQFIVAMLACALNERTARRLDYFQEENRVLRDALRAATGKTRILTLVHEGVENAAQVWRREVRAHPGTQSELQPPRGTVYQDHQV